MNGERRLRLTEKYMDPPGEAMPDCLIAARLANALEASFRKAGDGKYADQFKGFDWKTEEDAFMDGYNKHAGGGKHITYGRLRAAGTNGVQEPATGYANGKLTGTKRLFTDGKFGTKDGKAHFQASVWRGLQAKGREAQKAKYDFLINNGRKNLIWQNAFYDIRTPFVDERFPAPPIEMNPGDMKAMGVKAGDLVEVYNNVGSTQAMAYPIASAKKGECFMLFCSPRGQIGNVVSEHCNELRIPNYKNVWANIRKIGRAPNADAVSFKELEMPADV
jgi:arsenite oxidase large subunit